MAFSGGHLPPKTLLIVIKSNKISFIVVNNKTYSELTQINLLFFSFYFILFYYQNLELLFSGLHIVKFPFNHYLLT